MVHSEKSAGSDEALDGKFAALKIASAKRDAQTVWPRLARNLAENKVVAWEIGDNKGGAALAWLEICLRKGQDDDFAN